MIINQGKRIRKMHCYKAILRFQRYLILVQINSEDNSHIATPKRGKLPSTQKVKNTVNKKFLVARFKIRNCLQTDSDFPFATKVLVTISDSFP